VEGSILMLSGTAHLSIHGKRVVAESMYAKGKNFRAAAILLRQRGGYEYVVLHLICQGIEITLKALLLFKDYDRYKDQLRKPLDHNLNTIVAAASTEFSLRPISGTLATELAALNSLYSKHLLRYGTFYDILVNPQTIASDLTLHRIAAVIRLADRNIAAKP
jgi:hypothetical protein